MHKEAIDERTKRVWNKIAETGIAGHFYLAGGTALAVHLGHRKSIALAFFSQENFSIHIENPCRKNLNYEKSAILLLSNLKKSDFHFLDHRKDQ